MDNLQAGDVLFIDSGTFIGNMVKFISEFNFGHVAIMVSDTEMVDIKAFSKSSIVHINDIQFKRMVIKRTKQPLSREQVNQLVKISYENLGKPYDYKAIFSLFIRYIFKTKFKSHTYELDHLYCSEFVDYVYKAIDCDLLPENGNSLVGIDDLFMSDKLFIHKEVIK